MVRITVLGLLFLCGCGLSLSSKSISMGSYPMREASAFIVGDLINFINLSDYRIATVDSAGSPGQMFCREALLQRLKDKEVTVLEVDESKEVASFHIFCAEVGEGLLAGRLQLKSPGDEIIQVSRLYRLSNTSKGVMTLQNGGAIARGSL